ncbi:hypothetical protein, partial [Halorubrum tibetense]
MNNGYGQEVPQVVNTNPGNEPGEAELFRCDNEEAQWVGPDNEINSDYGRTRECNSGLNHDASMDEIDADGSWYQESDDHTPISSDGDCVNSADNDETDSGCQVGVTAETVQSSLGNTLLCSTLLISESCFDGVFERFSSGFAVEFSSE